MKLEENLVVISSWHIYNCTFYCLFVRPLLFQSADTLIYSPMVGRRKTFYVNNPSHEITESMFIQGISSTKMEKMEESLVHPFCCHSTNIHDSILQHSA